MFVSSRQNDTVFIVIRSFQFSLKKTMGLTPEHAFKEKSAKLLIPLLTPQNHLLSDISM